MLTDSELANFVQRYATADLLAGGSLFTPKPAVC